MGTTVQLLGTVKVFVPVTVPVKVPLIATENVPPVMPLIVTELVPVMPWGAVVVIVQGLPVLMLEIWNTRVVLIGTVKVVGEVTVAVNPPVLMLAENVPHAPNIQTVLPVVRPCGCAVVIIVGLPGVTLVTSAQVLTMPRVDVIPYAALVGLVYGLGGMAVV